jgi:hypothetical protein
MIWKPNLPDSQQDLVANQLMLGLFVSLALVALYLRIGYLDVAIFLFRVFAPMVCGAEYLLRRTHRLRITVPFWSLGFVLSYVQCEYFLSLVFLMALAANALIWARQRRGVDL